MEIKGTLKKVCPTEEIQGKNGTFNKRTIVIDCSSVDEVTGEVRENFIALETGGRFCADYDPYVDHVGEKVTVRFGISGRCYESNGQEKYINTLRIISLTLDNPVSPYEKQHQTPNPAPQPAPAPKPDYNQTQRGDGLPF